MSQKIYGDLTALALQLGLAQEITRENGFAVITGAFGQLQEENRLLRERMQMPSTVLASFRGRGEQLDPDLEKRKEAVRY